MAETTSLFGDAGNDKLTGGTGDDTLERRRRATTTWMRTMDRLPPEDADRPEMNTLIGGAGDDIDPGVARKGHDRGRRRTTM